jgi:hypothetical protein
MAEIITVGIDVCFEAAKSVRQLTRWSTTKKGAYAMQKHRSTTDTVMNVLSQAVNPNKEASSLTSRRGDVNSADWYATDER